MALSAKFLADFSSFSDAVAKADVQLKGFEQSGSRVATSLTRMSNSLSGTRLIQDAVLMAAGVEKIGGVSKLTEKELQRVGAQAQEAAAKLRALGLGVPENLQKIADAAKRVQPATDSLGASFGKLNSLLGAFGVGLSIGAVVSFGKAILNDADALVKLSDKTGITTQGLQRFQIAGDDAGNTIDQMTSAISQMQNRLTDGDKSAVGALRKLGLELEDIRKLTPENQFIAISDALRKIQDPAQQVNIAMDLFGRAGAEILPTLKRGFDDLKDSVVGMSDETVRALDEAGDMVDRFWRSVKAVSAETLVGSVRALEDAFWGIGRAGGNAVREAQALRLEIERMAKAVPPAVKDLPAQLQVPTSDSPEVKREERDQDDRDKRRKKALDDLNAAAKRLADEGLRLVRDRLKDIDPGTVTFKVVGLTDAVKALNVTAIDFPLTEAVKALRTEAVPTMDAIADAVRRGPLAAFGDLADEIRKLERTGLSNFMGDLEDVGGRFEGLPPKIEDVERSLSDLSQAFANLAQISGGSFGGVLQAIGLVVGALDVAITAVGKLEMTLDAAGQSTGLATTGSGLVAWISLAGIAIDTANRLNKAMGLESTRDLVTRLGSNSEAVTAFIAAAGGVDALLAKTGLTLGELQGAVARALSAKTADDFAAALQVVNDRLSAAQQILDDTRAAGFLSTDELTAAAERAHKVYEQIAAGRVAGQYTREQEIAAERLYQEALSKIPGIIGEAAREWLKLNDVVGKVASAQQKALDALVSQRDSIAASYANEAWEPEMGSIEKAAREQVADLDAMINAQHAQMEAAAAEAAQVIADTVGTAADETEARLHAAMIGGLDGAASEAEAARSAIDRAFSDFRIVIPIDYEERGGGPRGGITWHPPGTRPDGEVPEDVLGVLESSMNSFAGGTHGQYRDFGRGTLALLHGREKITPEAEGRRETNTGITVGQIVVQMTVTENVDAVALEEILLQVMRTKARVYDGIAIIADRRIAAGS